MHKSLASSCVVLFFLWAATAHAVPRFSRQTGLSCNVCHSNPPELTAFGRDFKLRGFLQTEENPADTSQDKRNLWLSRSLPFSAMIQLSDTAGQKKQPGTQNGTVEFPQQLSIFLAGKFAPHFGGLAQFTYSHSSDHFSMDNTDLRYANQTKVHGKDLQYGITVNNNPSVEDLWNSTPAWGFPWVSSDSAVTPIASPVIRGNLAQDVAGAGAYGMWNHHLYADLTVYRSEHAGGPVPATGMGQTYNIDGVAPYWRAAWQQRWDKNYLELGTYGIYLQSFPNAISGNKDRYADPSFDFQYERPFGSNLLDAHGSFTHEVQGLDATFASGGASTKSNHLNSFTFDSTFHWKNRFGATGNLFSTTGNSDRLLYAQTSLTGSRTGSPNSTGYTGQLAYWPVQNLDLSVSYTGYTKFNGATTNYDGAKRNASDNNALYVTLWLIF